MNTDKLNSKHNAAAAQHEAFKKIPLALPTYVSERDGDILIESVFMTETEVGSHHSLSRERINQIKHKYEEVYQGLILRRDELLACLTRSNSYLANKRIREFLVSPDAKVERVSDASLMASLATQSVKSTLALQPQAAVAPPDDWKALAASTPSSMVPSSIDPDKD